MCQTRRNVAGAWEARSWMYDVAEDALEQKTGICRSRRIYLIRVNDSQRGKTLQKPDCNEYRGRTFLS